MNIDSTGRRSLYDLFLCSRLKWTINIIKPGGNYLSVGCSKGTTDTDASPKIANFAGGDINVYVNTNVINLSGAVSDPDVKSYGSLLNIYLTWPSDSGGKKRWMYYDYQKDAIIATGKELILRSEGEPFFL